MLVDAVVIAGDGSGADVHVAADVRVSDVREVRGLGPRREHRFLRLDEIADLHFAPQDGAGAEMSIRADASLALDHRVFRYRAGLEPHVVANADVAQMNARLDDAVAADRRLSFERNERIDDGVLTDVHATVD